ncbi:hypothetical protein RFI_15970 [Reticulomyxa filosa]|uniref:E3 ubiquitin-protein ligase n=1 Tax=Reticulomyxa filosa TaxID=46433 RepID=X6N649_RETFI|nr:hypothetical protein RFI_15970 [Reticulomyxa filosa]|eukprot:ETO21239.1 hypothetical protein RFI_15970 [Reticulomyxa filosa]
MVDKKENKQVMAQLSKYITQRHEAVIKECFSRIKNISFYTNEKNIDAQHFGWKELKSTPQQVQDRLLPSLLCNILAYNISSLETRFRNYSRKEIQDKLPRTLQLNNTIISNIWRLFAVYSLQKQAHTKQVLFSNPGMDDLYQNSWTVLEALFGPSSVQAASNEASESQPIDANRWSSWSLGGIKSRVSEVISQARESEEMKETKTDITNYKNIVHTQEPFNVVVRGLLTHPHAFSMTEKKKAELTSTSLSSIRSTSSDVVEQSSVQSMEVDIPPLEQNLFVVNDIYHLLLSCYVWKILQVTISHVAVTEKIDLEQCAKQTPSEWLVMMQKILESGNGNKLQEVVQHLSFHVLPFLRKCYILLYSCGLTELDSKLLWTCTLSENVQSSSSDTKTDTMYEPEDVLIECDDICARLCLPTLEEYVGHVFSENEKSPQELTGGNQRFLPISKFWTKNYFEHFTPNERKYILRIHGIDSIRPVSLATLPRLFDPIFKRAYKEKCSGGKTPVRSAICLFCGEFLCIDCCRVSGKGGLTVHSKSCGRGKGMFLWLQMSSVVLMYEHAAAIFNSPYLDNHGEEDNGLKRGNLLSLSDMRVHELQKLVADEGIPNKVCQMRSGPHYESNWF